jgi:hypothetical protein
MLEDVYLYQEAIPHMEQIFYWTNRFDVSREIEHIDNAIRHADAAKLYLPKCCQGLSVIGLYHLYLSSPSLSR